MGPTRPLHSGQLEHPMPDSVTRTTLPSTITPKAITAAETVAVRSHLDRRSATRAGS